MLIPLINPQRPPKKWWTKKVKELSKRYSRPEQVAGWIWYHKVKPKTKKRIFKELERPARRRSISNPTKESGMAVFSLAGVKPRKGTRLFSSVRKTARKRRTRRRKGGIRFGWHRPTLLYTRGGWRRPRHSALMPRPVRVNARRRRRRRNPETSMTVANPRRRRYTKRYYRSYRRSYRRNPIRMPKLPFQIQKVALTGVKMAGGIALGMFLMPAITKIVPESSRVKFRPFLGIVHIVLGAVGAATIKNNHVKDVALAVAGVGVYDLIASNLKILGLPQIMAGDVDEYDAVGSSYQTVAGDVESGIDSSSMVPAMGSSYQEVGDDISYGGDDIEIG